MLNNSRRKVLEKRDQLPPHPDAGEARIGVARVLGEGERVTTEMPQDVRSSGREERTDERRALGPRRARGKDREPARARPAEQAEEEGLGAVVGGVAGRDDLRMRLRRSVAKGLEAGCAGSGLEVRARPDLNPGDREGHPFCLRHLPRELELRGRLRSEAVIDPVGDKLVPDPLPQQGKDVEQRGRVRSAGASAEHHIASTEERLVADRPLAAPEQRRRVGSPRGPLPARRTGRLAYQSSNALQKTTSSRPSRLGSRCGSFG
jgi:hypothetical protein